MHDFSTNSVRYPTNCRDDLIIWILSFDFFFFLFNPSRENGFASWFSLVSSDLVYSCNQMRYFPYRRKSEYFPSIWFIWACNGEVEIGSAIKKSQAVSNTGIYESNDQNEVTELSDSDNNFICLHALKLEGHKSLRWEQEWICLETEWEALELVAVVIFDFLEYSPWK